MSKSSIAYSNLQYENYAGWYLKAYEPTTTFPKEMYTSSTGFVSFAKIQLNVDGFPESTGGAKIIPFIDGHYDLWLFPTAKEADQNDTANAIRMAVNITAESTLDNVATATYIENGVVSLLDEGSVDIIYDLIDNNLPFITPPISQLPDFTALREMIQREVGGGSGGAVEITDGIITLRDLALPNYIPEIKDFIRADHVEIDTAMGAYSPISKDFTNYISEDILLPKVNTEPPSPSTGTYNESNNVVFRNNGLFGDFYFTLRSDELVLMNKLDMTVVHTLTPDVGTRWVNCGIVGGKLLLWTETIGIRTSAHIYEVNNDFLGVTNVKTITGLRSGHYAFSWYACTIIDAVGENYFYISLPSLALQAVARGTVSIIKVLKDYTEHSKTLLTHDSSIALTDISAKSYYIFYNKAEKQLRAFFTTRSATSILPPIYAEIPDILLNQIDNTLVTKDLPLAFSQRLGKIDLNLLEEDATGLSSYSTIPPSDFIFNESKNEIIVTGSFPQVGVTVAFENVVYISYDAISGKVKNVIFQNELEDFIDESDVNFGNFNTEGGTISSLSQFGVNSSVDVNIGNKVYQPLVWNTGTLQGIVFINTDDGIDMIKNRPHTVDSTSGALYLFCGHKIVSDEQNVIYFTDGRGDNSNSNRTVRKLTMIDSILESPTRPAPILNAVAPMKGFIRSK